jgi:two-component system, NarL family, nitrate/nitrite response regulator NarL
MNDGLADHTRGGRTRVSIVEDHTEIREGLRTLVDDSSSFQCVGTYGSVEAAVPGIARDGSEIVLMDLGLPGMSGIEGIRRLRAVNPDLRLVALTVFEDDDRVFEALCAGASGYVLKKTPPARLMDCLEDVRRGGAAMSPEVASRVLTMFRDIRRDADGSHRLTPHELRILQLLAEGHSYKTAAAQLSSSVHTVAFHMKSIYSKLEVHSKSEAVAKALRHRLVR